MSKFQLKDLTGSLFRNTNKSKDTQPDYYGNALIDSKEFTISAWLKEGKKGKFLSLKFQKPEPEKIETKSSRFVDDDGMPF